MKLTFSSSTESISNQAVVKGGAAADGKAAWTKRRESAPVSASGMHPTLHTDTVHDQRQQSHDKKIEPGLATGVRIVLRLNTARQVPTLPASSSDSLSKEDLSQATRVSKEDLSQETRACLVRRLSRV